MQPAPSPLVFRANSVIIFGVVALLFGGLVFVVAGQQSTFSCYRDRNVCVFEKSGLFSSSSEELPLQAIDRAELTQRRSRSSDGYYETYYRAVLHTAQGTRHLSSVSSTNRGTHQRSVNEVNRFLADHTQMELVTAGGAGGLFRLIALLPFVAGLFMIFGTRNVVKVSADPATRKLQIDKRRWWQGQGQTTSLDLDAISRVEIEERVSNNARRRHGHTRSVSYRVVIVTTSGESVPLFSFHTSGRGVFARRDAIEGLLRGVSAAGLTSEPPHQGRAAGQGGPGIQF